MSASGSARAAAFGGTTVDPRVRQCASVDLMSKGQLPPPICILLRELEALRSELAAATHRPLLEEAELQLLSYPPGGHYHRHVDDGLSTSHLQVRRSISLILYLTDDDWSVETDGGALRVHSTSGEGWYDVAPEAGTLVLFDSSSVVHEVLKTSRSRLACVGWFLVDRTREHLV